MGPFAAVVPYALAAVGAYGVNKYNTDRTLRKQDRALAEGIIQKSAKQRIADQKVSDIIAETEASRAEPGTAYKQYQDAVRGTEQQARAGEAIEGLSKEYDVATSAAGEARRGEIDTVANLLARMDAASQQREREGQKAANLGQDLGIIRREQQGIDFAAQMKANNVRRNAWLDALSTALSAYAGGAGGATGAASGGAAGAGNAGSSRYAGGYRMGTGPD